MAAVADAQTNAKAAAEEKMSRIAGGLGLPGGLGLAGHVVRSLSTLP